MIQASNSLCFPPLPPGREQEPCCLRPVSPHSTVCVIPSFLLLQLSPFFPPSPLHRIKLTVFFIYFIFSRLELSCLPICGFSFFFLLFVQDAARKNQVLGDVSFVDTFFRQTCAMNHVLFFFLFQKRLFTAPLQAQFNMEKRERNAAITKIKYFRTKSHYPQGDINHLFGRTTQQNKNKKNQCIHSEMPQIVCCEDRKTPQ